MQKTSILSTCNILVNILISAGTCLYGQDDQSIVPGKTIDTVFCQNAPDHSYALYLPTYYDEDEKWPVIYIFEPGARGALPVDSLKFDAEKYGYILAGSNNSRNGPWDIMFEAGDIMFEDVEDRFPIDFNRVYTAGFSGGSRAALAIAVLTGKIAGVIGCGAALPPPREYQPTENSSFVYFGLVGIKDMNYHEMFDLMGLFKGYKIPAWLHLFDGGHQWPSPHDLVDALEWLELQGMLNGKVPKDPDFIQSEYDKWMDKAHDLEQNNALTEVVRHSNHIVELFSDDVDVSSVKIDLDRLRTSKDFQNAEKEKNKTRNQELALRERYLEAFDHMLKPQVLTDSIKHWWQKEIWSIEKMQKSKNQNVKWIAYRILNMMSATCIEWGWGQMAMKQYDIAEKYFDIGVLVQPKNKFTYYNLSRAQILNGNPKAGLVSLSRAVKYGLSQRSVLETDAAFDPIREEKKFIAILDQLH